MQLPTANRREVNAIATIKQAKPNVKAAWVRPDLYLKGKWSEWRDSNSRPSGPKPDALPGCATLRRCFHIPPDTEFQAFILCKIRFILLFLRTSRIYRRYDWQMQPRQRPKPEARRLAAANFQNILSRFLRFAGCQTKRFSIGNYAYKPTITCKKQHIKADGRVFHPE